jgi:two-component system sensor histidine kinase BaeS
MRRPLQSWSRLSLRWRLVLLNAVIIVVSGVVLLELSHRIAEPYVMDVMNTLLRQHTADAAQRMYDDQVTHQILPAIAIAAAVAIVLNLCLVGLALRPLRAVQQASRRIATGDVSARVGLERRDEIGEVSRAFDEMATSLERLEGLRRQATNDVAHELRTPIHNLLGLIEGMRDGVFTADAVRLEQAHREVLRLRRLVDDVQLLADAQSARDRLARARVDLFELAADVMRSFQADLEQQTLAVQVTGIRGETVVDGDAGRLAQVLRNIIANAIRYARTGTPLGVAVTRAGALARVTVTDHGEAIPADALPYIFERFFRADQSRTRDGGGAGAGIGLAIVKELIEAHGGRVGATSTADGAVSVWFELPLAAIPHQLHMRDTYNRDPLSA